ncbi:tripartite tricarboxylate transporter TctB family protein [Mumia sp. DW29H23]|uniref:tripartite tricarboxylate transporter TctB family protein n=1 Tax=Mumia sp. DW29H23 TaxID=3421241 RepID=UPI003D69D594
MKESSVAGEAVQERPPEPVSRKSRLASWIALAAVLVFAVVFLVEALNMKVGTLSAPGPALWPTIVAALLAVTCLVGFALDLTAGEEPFERGSFRVAAAAVALYLFIVLFTYTGSILAGFVLLTFWLKALAKESWRLSLTVAALGSLASYFLFVGLLGVVFPDDLVASLWGGR